MLMEEFEQRTGIYPTQDLYEEIERRYNATDMDKDEFCKMYKENADGLAEEIQRDATMRKLKEKGERAKEILQKEKVISTLKNEIEDLKKRLEWMQGWEQYEVSKMDRSRYELLRARGTEMDKVKAVCWIEEEFGFSSDRIEIKTEIPRYEKSREGYIRKSGTAERPPVYEATDWNYIRFDVNNWQYEVVNGQLYQYAD